MLEDALARVLRHRNDGFTHPFATERSPGTEDFARLLRNLEGAGPDRVAPILDAVDAVAGSHQGCPTCRGKVLVFAELLSIQRLPERHAGYAGATECLARETGRDFRREVLEHLASCCRPVRPRLRARELQTSYQDLLRRSPWALHLEGLSEALAARLAGQTQWVLVVGGTDSARVLEDLRCRRSPGKPERLAFAAAELIQEGLPHRERCALFWSPAEALPVQAQVLAALPEGATAVTCENTQLRLFRQGQPVPETGPLERVNEALRVLLGLPGPPFVQALDCRSGFEAWARQARGETVCWAEASGPKRPNRSREVLNELRRRKQQRVEEALAEAQLPEAVRRLLVDCLPLWKDEPDTLIGDLLPTPRRCAGSKRPNPNLCREAQG
jgi:hypothetical protein